MCSVQLFHYRKHSAHLEFPVLVICYFTLRNASHEIRNVELNITD